MRKVEFLDTTLRDGEQTPGVNFSVKEKVAIAKQLEKWGIASIEAGFPAASPDSFEAVRQISEAMTTTAVSGLARSVKSDIDACYEALKDAKFGGAGEKKLIRKRNGFDEEPRKPDGIKRTGKVIHVVSKRSEAKDDEKDF